MIRILDRYVAREFMSLFVRFALAAPVLFIIGDWTDHLDEYTAPERGLTPLKVGLGYLYQMPEFISYSIPIAALIATVFTVSHLTRHSEMAAAKAGGISFYRALAVLPLIGIVLTLAGFGLADLVPRGTAKKNEIMGAKNRLSGYSRSDFVYIAESGYAVVVRSLDVDSKRINGIAIQREGNGKDIPTELIIADSAVYRGNRWHLMNGVYRTFVHDTAQTIRPFTELVSEQFHEEPSTLTATPKEPEEMTYAELGHYIEVQQASGTQPRKLMVVRAQKFAIPVATLIIILFGAPLANTSARGGPAYGIGLSLGVTVVYLMMFNVTKAMGWTGVLSPFWAAWLPNAAFLVAAIIGMFRIRT
jgi:lipopolysaccharide export system permease protein